MVECIKFVQTPLLSGVFLKPWAIAPLFPLNIFGAFHLSSFNVRIWKKLHDFCSTFSKAERFGKFDKIGKIFQRIKICAWDIQNFRQN